MRRILQLGKRLRNLGWKPSVEDEVDLEMEHHLELMIRDGIERGLSREEAERAARDRFGTGRGVRRVCEAEATARDRRAGIVDWWDRIRTDVSWAIRSLRTAPGHLATVVLVTALVVGANAVMLALVDSVVLRPLPYPEAGRLVSVKEITVTGDRWDISWPNLDDWRRDARQISLAGWLRDEVTLQVEPAARIQIALVDPGFFPVVGVTPARGRSLSAADERIASMVLSEAAWRRYFGADPGIIGRTARLNRATYTIVGVMPASFRLPDDQVAGWVPLGSPPDWMRNRSVHVIGTLGRIAAGATLREASAELETIGARIEASRPGEDPRHRPVVESLQAALIGRTASVLLVLWAGIGIALLVALVNLAVLTVTRALGRDGELAVRSALGASRGALVRQLAIEGAGLGLLGGLAGAAIALGALGPLRTWLPDAFPRIRDVGLAPWHLAAAVGLGTAMGLATGLLAAIRVSRPDLGRRMAEGGRGSIGLEEARLQPFLLAGQLGVTVILVVGALLLLRSFQAARSMDPGFAADDLTVATVSVPAGHFERARMLDWYRDLPARVRRVPGVVAASAVSELPISGGDGMGDVTVEGRAFPAGGAPGASFRRVLPGYFDMMGIALRRGRQLDDRDGRSGAPVVIVNESMARAMWPGQDPIGRRIKVGPPEHEPWLTVVGVVADVRNVGLDRDPGFATYEPHAQRPRSTMTVTIRTAGTIPPGALEAAIRDGDPEIQIWGRTTMLRRVDGSLAPRRIPTQIVAGFGALTLLLAVIGVYGVAGYAVSRRRREIAIRMALGARPGAVRRLIVAGTLRAAGLGVVIGLLVAVAGASRLEAMLFGVSPLDPVSLLGAVGLLGVTALLAAWLPSRRAAGTDAAEVTRSAG